MSEVLKYEVSRGLDCVARGGKVVLAGRQDDKFYVWVWRDDAMPTRAMRIYGTGQHVSPEWNHVYSFQDGAYVWHVFECAL